MTERVGGSLCGLPACFEALERFLRERAAFGPCGGFHLPEAALKLVGGPLQGPLGRQPHLAAEVGEGKQHVSVFVLDGRTLQAVQGHGLTQFGDFLVNFVEDGKRIGPVEPDGGGPCSDLFGAQQRRQGAGNASEQGLLRLACLGAFGGLDVVPLGPDASRRDVARGRQGQTIGRKHVRMAANELVDHGLQGVGQGEVPGFAAELCNEHRLEDDIAEFLADARPVAFVYGVEQLAGFLEDERAEGGEGLLAVPWAALGTAQHLHDFDESVKVRASRTGHGRMLSFEDCAHG